MIPKCKICGFIFSLPTSIKEIKQHMNIHIEYRKDMDNLFRDYERRREEITKEAWK